jgi:3-methyladenine DNA glycosylase AlkD
MSDFTVPEALGELAALEDPKMRAANEKRGDDHGINLSRMRALAKQIKTDQPLAQELWATGETPAQLLALLICQAARLHRRRARRDAPRDPTAEGQRLVRQLRREEDPARRRAATALVRRPRPHGCRCRLVTHDRRVMKDPEGLDLPHLLDLIERDMKDAPSRLQWAMNETLANIGIFHPEHRVRALEIGEHLQVLADYPTPPGCTSPFAPLWIGEIVRRREG